MKHRTLHWPLARVWHEIYRERINKEVLATRASLGAAATLPVLEEPPVNVEPSMVNDPDEMEVSALHTGHLIYLAMKLKIFFCSRTIIANCRQDVLAELDVELLFEKLDLHFYF
jgi:hypothetical protein